MNEVGNNAIYNRLCNYQAYLRYVLIKTAAESTDSIRFDEICKKIEGNSNKLLEGLDTSFIPLLKNYPNLVNSCLRDVLPLAIATSALHKATQKYISYCFSKGNSEYAVRSQNLISKQKLFISAKDDYEIATGRKLGSEFVSVLKEFAYCQAKEKEALIAKMYSDLSELLATSISGAECGCLRDDVVQNDSLPDTIQIGAFKDSGGITPDKLIDLDIDEIIAGCGKHNLSVNIRENGNIIINAQASSGRDDALYDHICNIVLKYYDSFPIGALRVHFIDPLMDPKFAKFISGFQNGNTNEKTRVAVELVSKYDMVAEKLETRCNDLMTSKLVGSTRDIYDLFNIDSNEYLDLVVIRNGFADIARNGSKSVLLNLINSFDHTSRSHRCGIRFIVVNDLNFDDSRLDADLKKNIEFIVSDAELVLDYNNGSIQCQKKNIVPLAIESGREEEKFIESKCSKIGAVLSKNAGKAITYEELGCFDIQSSLASAIIEIPVGKSGSEIVSIPFSCADSDNSDAAKNIGLMVLGQSGSGKSSLYHSIIVNGSMKYAPSELQFWLLDFKNNSSAGIYSSTDNNIPHIKVVAPNSKKNDAYNILRILNDEMQYRLDLFNDIGNRYGVKLSNVLEYNRFIEEEEVSECQHLPRIILMIDEAQELFRDAADGTSDELPKQIGTYINRLVSLGRSSGIHMAMFAQNLDSQKTYILKDSFINQLKCKVCFRLSSSSVVNSGFKGEFDKRKDEIESLGTGEIYLSYSNTEIKKCRVAYASGSKLIQYLGDIVNKYSSIRSSVLKIGLTSQLSALDYIPHANQKYIDKVVTAYTKNGKMVCTIGEDAYSLQPVNVVFEPTKISSTFLVGNSRSVAMSVFTSLLLGLNKIGCDIRICNGMQREDNMYNALLNNAAIKVTKYSLFDIDKYVGEAYVEYKKRKSAEEKTGEYDNTPIVLFLNDFDAQDKVKQNVEIRLDNYKPAEPPRREAKSLLDILNIERQKQTASEPVQVNVNEFLNGIRLKDAIGELLKNAYQYNIYLVVLLKETWYREFDDALKASGNVVIFNESDYSSVVDSYLIKDLLKDIRQRRPARSINSSDEEDDTETDNESFAILRRKKEFLKFRPVIYHTNNENEKVTILKTLEDK